jgi:hypothetical protein
MNFDKFNRYISSTITFPASCRFLADPRPTGILSWLTNRAFNDEFFHIKEPVA